MDLTGGVSELISLQDDGGDMFTDDSRAELFSRLETELGAGSLVCSAIRSGPSGQSSVTDTGLVRGAAYPVTGVRRVTLSESGLVTRIIRHRERLCLVRLRCSVSSDDGDQRLYDVSKMSSLLTRSSDWRSVSVKEREKLGLMTSHNTEVWIPWDDFLHQFTDLSITHTINTSVWTFNKTWREFRCTSEWRKPARAGGCFNHVDTFLNNPQFRFDVSQPNTEVIIHLSQLPQHKKSILNTSSDKSRLVIGFHILRVESNRECRLHSIMKNSDVASCDYIRSTHVSLRKRLDQGRYFLIPTTFSPGHETGFLLRVWSDQCSGVTSVTRDSPRSGVITCWSVSAPTMVTRLTVVSASDLSKQGIMGGESINN